MNAPLNAIQTGLYDSGNMAERKPALSPADSHEFTVFASNSLKTSCWLF